MSPRGSLLLVEPYYGGSHRVWADGLAAHLSRPVAMLTLPARWWKWRMRGAAATLAERCADLDGVPAMVLASDMLDVAAFRALARPYLGDVPVGLYFHESQLTYPDSPRAEPDLHYAFTNWQSALAADRVFFNSAYHREAFFAELPRLLRHFPDFTHEHLIGIVEAKSEVLHVGVDLGWASEPIERSGPPRLVWNHRWEHDKDPEAFFAAVDVLADEGHDFEVVVCGENFSQDPVVFEQAAQRHPGRIVHMGYLPVDEYRARLRESDVVVSTAHQEFFGIAVVEAVAAGCFPVLPSRLSYPELIPSEWHDQCLYPPGGLVARLREVITRPEVYRKMAGEISPAMTRFAWPRLVPRYEEALDRLGWRA